MPSPSTNRTGDFYAYMVWGVPSYTISGTVFEDCDADGLDDGEGEPGFAGGTGALIDAGPDSTI